MVVFEMNNDYNNSTVINQDFSVKMNDEIADGGIAADFSTFGTTFCQLVKVETNAETHALFNPFPKSPVFYVLAEQVF